MMLTLEQIAEGRRIAAVEGPDDGRAGANAWHYWLEAHADALLAAAEHAARQEQPRTGAKVEWSYNKQPVPGHPEWYFQIGLGAPCWFVILKRDTYTSVHIDPHTGVSAHHAPPEIVRWLLDNHPPLDSWRKPTEDEVKRSWATSDEQGAP